MSVRPTAGLILIALLAGCPSTTPEPLETPLLEVPETASYALEGLSGTAFVIRTEGNIPHIYARNRADLSMVHGFVVAQDRFFMMDMSRRLALGTVAEILGEDALGNDMESRGNGMRQIAENIAADLREDPEILKLVESYAMGINHYIDEVRAGLLPPPSEYALAAPLLGAENAVDLMAPFAVKDVAAGLATIVFELGFETGDARRGMSHQRLDGYYTDVPNAELRNVGLRDDLWNRVEPVFNTQSAPNWTWPNSDTEDDPGEQDRAAQPPPSIPPSLSTRFERRLDRLDRRLKRNHGIGFGSNAWAVAGRATADGRSLHASDGHLPLTVAPLFYQLGLNTEHLGDGPVHQLGMVIPGMFSMGPGTNGHTAWSQTQLFGDITDWYVESIQLDESGKPFSSTFQGEEAPLVRHEETFVVRDVPLLGSEGRTESWERWTTFDGRVLASIEGRSASPDEALNPGEALVQMQGDWVVPEDTNGDGIITGISFDYVPLDGTGMFKAVDEFGFAKTVEEWRESTKKLVGYSQNMVVSDAKGSILYSSYQAIPCRSYLPKDADGDWVDHANPGLLIDGTQYGGFEIPRNGHEVDESIGQNDPSRCVVPWEAVPWSQDPDQGFLLNANNDPGGISTDGDLMNDPYYIGGPWLEGYRADTIEQVLAEEAQANTASIASMQSLQANHQSRIGEQFIPLLSEAIQIGKEAMEAGETEGTTGRMASIYSENEAEFQDVLDRLTAWCNRGCWASSGVRTFYSVPTDEEINNAVATMIFNAWYGRFLHQVFGDEGLPSGVWFPTGDSGRQRTITRLLAARGEHNSQGVSSWDSQTQESVFFDNQLTEEVESSDELMLIALEDALSFLKSEPKGPGEGGFGSDRMDDWVWGLRHWVKFESVLAELVGDDATFAMFTNPFAITPARIPLEDNLLSGDPRKNLPGFPRPGDQLNVDAANPGTDGNTFDYGSGPVFRMVIALGPDGPEGYNILPGGQSGLKESPHFDDQVKLWLGNEAWPMRFHLDDVLEGATGRETFKWVEHRGH